MFNTKRNCIPDKISMCLLGGGGGVSDLAIITKNQIIFE